MSSSVNIDSKGYGKIYKSVMRNRQLPLLAKAIYVYLCAYAGNGQQSYPKRDKIIRDLKINKDTYTKHLSTLVTEGYISKERTAAGNIYTILQTVPGYDKSVRGDNKRTDMLIVKNVGAQGFGTVPKIIMLDTRLTAQAKAIYAYFASFAGAGTTAFPRRATIMRDLGLHSAAYYSHFNLLLELGYLSVEHRKSNGKYDVSLYRLSESVESSAQHCNGKQKALSQKPLSEKTVHGKASNEINKPPNKGVEPAPTSKNPVHGEMLKTSDAVSEKEMPGKPMSEEATHGDFGHANINNNPTTNNYFENQQVDNHQGSGPRDDAPVFLFSLEQTKEIMRYEDLRCEAIEWGDLKEKLGHFSTSKDKARYLRRAIEILDEVARQVVSELNNMHNRKYIVDTLNSEAFVIFFDEVLARWDEIRSVKKYVGVAIRNLLSKQ